MSRFQSYTTANGPVEDSFASSWSGLKTKDKRLFFGLHNAKGLIVIDPNNVPERNLQPGMVLTDFLVSGTSVPLGTSTLPVHISEVGEVTLRHEEDNFTVAYTGIETSAPNRVRYAYRLDGYDEQWQEVGQERD